jgi:integrin beta 3
MSDKPQTLVDAIGVCLALGQRCLAEVRALARQPGPQGPPGPAGQNAADVQLFKDYIDQQVAAHVAGIFSKATVTSPDDGRTFHVKLGGVTHTITTALPIDRGVWRDGAYKCGDAVSHGGSIWIAQQDTDTKPDSVDSHWRLAVKRGRDGKDGKPGERGPIGAKGERGERGGGF